MLGSSKTRALLVALAVIGSIVPIEAVSAQVLGSKPIIKAVTPIYERNTTGSYTRFDVTVVNEAGNPWTGTLGWSTYYYANVSANQRTGFVSIYNGSGSFGYYGYNVGTDLITVGVSATDSGEAVASREWVAAGTPLPTDARPIVKVVTPATDVRKVGDYTSFDVKVVDHSGTPWNGYLRYNTSAYADISVNKSYGWFWVGNGNGSFGYYGYNAGTDLITVDAGGTDTGHAVATRTWTATTTPLPSPTPLPTASPLPTATPPPAPDADVVTVTVEPVNATKTVGEYITLRGIAKDSSGRVVTNNNGFFWDVYGANSGKSGRGEYFTYKGDVIGPDAVTAQAIDTNGHTIPGALGQAAVAWTPSTSVAATPVSLVFDQEYYDIPEGAPYYGYHGFTVRDANGRPVNAPGLEWTATVTGVNGPLTFGGRLDWQGRGWFGYSATKDGLDVLEAHAGTAVGVARRSYAIAEVDVPPLPGVEPPPVNPPPLDPLPEPPRDVPIPGAGSDADLLNTPPGQVLVLDANVVQRLLTSPPANCWGVSVDMPSDNASQQQLYHSAKDCDPNGRIVRFAERVAALGRKVTYDGSGYAPDVIALQEIYKDRSRMVADALYAATDQPYAIAVHSEDFNQSVYEEDTVLIYNTQTMRTSGNGREMTLHHPDVKSKRNVAMAFQETEVANGARPVEIAVASIHYALGFPSYPVAHAAKAEWASTIQQRMQTYFPNAVMRVVAGDFNEVRCTNQQGPRLDGTELADVGSAGGAPYTEPLVCEEHPMHQTFAKNQYYDSVYMANARTSSVVVDQNGVPHFEVDPTDDGGTLNRQYIDGDQWRKRRIDHIFASGVDTYLSSSYDISCGDLPSAPAGRRSCVWLKSPHRYSDHRIVWALVGANPRPSQDIVDGELER